MTRTCNHNNTVVREKGKDILLQFQQKRMKLLLVLLLTIFLYNTEPVPIIIERFPYARVRMVMVESDSLVILDIYSDSTSYQTIHINGGLEIFYRACAVVEKFREE